MTTEREIVEKAAAAGWAALKARCAADPETARRVVMVSEADYASTIHAVIRALAEAGCTEAMRAAWAASKRRSCHELRAMLTTLADRAEQQP
jgi:hypothetical protein